MNLKRITTALIFLSLITSQTQALQWFPQPNQYNYKKIGLIALATTAVIGAGAYAVHLYLNSPKRIKNKYQAALKFYQAHKTNDLVTQYQKFSNAFHFTYSELTTDIKRLSGQESTFGVPELQEALLELQPFVYNVETYVLENTLRSSVHKLEQSYAGIIKAVNTPSDESKQASNVKKIILSADDSLYPCILFEKWVGKAIDTLNSNYTQVYRRSKETDLLNHAHKVIEQLISVRSYIRALPEFREERREQEKARKEEEREQARQGVEQEKLKLERAKLAAKLAKEQKPTVVIVNNTNNNNDENNKNNNPYNNGGFYDADGYYWPA